MGADDIQNEFRLKAVPVVLTKRRTVVFQERMSQHAFIFHPALKPAPPSHQPFGLAGNPERGKSFAHGQVSGFFPEGKHPVGIKRSALQICLVFGCQNQGVRLGGTFHVNSFRLHGLPDVAERPIVSDVNAFFAAIETHPHKWNSNRVMFFRALVDRTEVVMRAELFERFDQRSSLWW